jgi:hypothetical protein
MIYFWLVIIWVINQVTWWNIFYGETILIELYIRYHITSSKKYKRFRGCCVAFFAQTLWFVIFLKSEQYLLLALTLIDACIWCRGVFRNWPKKRGRRKK